ncbi:MAG: glycosyltransferase family 4 protein [Chthoniobacterales bacterium]
MKISIVLGFFNPCPPVRGGGVERMWYQLAQEFARLGNEVTILSRSWPDFPDREQEGGIRHIRLPGFSHRKKLLENLLLDVLWSFRIIFNLPQADILITNSIFLPVLSVFFRARGITVVNLNRYPKGQLKYYTRVPRIQTPSSAIAHAAALQAPAIASRICVIPNSTDLTPFFAIKPPKDKSILTIGFVGRVHPEKGLELLIDAATHLLKKSDLPAWKIVITGPYKVSEGGGGEEYYDRLKKSAIRSMEQGRLEFLPPVFSRDELTARYADMDIFCYPSVAEKGETFGIAILEAMASGLPVTASNLACFSDLVDKNQTGLLFNHTKANASVALATDIASLLHDSEKRNAFGKAGRAKAQLFDVKPVAQLHLDDFKKLLESGAK